MGTESKHSVSVDIVTPDEFPVSEEEIANELLAQNGTLDALKIMENMNMVNAAIKKLEEAQENWKKLLKRSMEIHGIKSVKNEWIEATYVEATTSVGLDQTKLKKEYQEVYIECQKKTDKAAYIKISYR